MSSTSPNKDRRLFLSQASFAVASMGVVGLPRPWTMAPQSPAASAREKTAIQRTLGRTGITLPIVSMGVMNANNPEMLKAAYEAGYACSTPHWAISREETNGWSATWCPA